MNFEQSLMNHDKPLIKWWNILQNYNVDKKSWSLTVYRSQLTFALTHSIFGPLEQLTDQTSSARLEIWHGWTWEHIRTLGEHLRSFGCKDLDATQNPNFDLTALGGDLTWQFFDEYGRANFGVQQLPLFNFLRPEDIDWLSSLSWSEGGR